MKAAPDGKEIKQLPDSAFDFLIELWARSHNLEITSTKKIPKEEGTTWREKND